MTEIPEGFRRCSVCEAIIENQEAISHSQWHMSQINNEMSARRRVALVEDDLRLVLKLLESLSPEWLGKLLHKTMETKF